jgi:hypothetical protein
MSAAGRYLLMIVGDGTEFFSAPADCESVTRVKAEVAEAFKHKLAQLPMAGVGVLAMALCSRIHGDAHSVVNGRARYSRVYAGKASEPLTHGNDDFNYEVDAAKLIHDDELANWTSHGTSWMGGSDQFFQVQILDDCC